MASLPKTQEFIDQWNEEWEKERRIANKNIEKEEKENKDNE